MPEHRELRPRTVAEINEEGYTFYVPDYQRGYRWTKEQVTKLLDDLAGWEDKAAYSLQPVIVHQPGQDDSTLHVVDGQQRLTTIALVLGKETNYALKYETRPETSEFLQELKNGADPYEGYDLQHLFGKEGLLRKRRDTKKHTIDNYHLLAAYRAIEDWKKQEGNRARFQRVRETLRHAEILWYCIRENPRIVFARINSGKIQLGNADLIKATLLKDEAERRLLISRQWDEVEQQLADDSFWAFLGQDLTKKYNRIEVLVRLITPKGNKRASDTAVHALYNDCVAAYGDGRHGTRFLRLWEDLWVLFETLREWYRANPIYHRVGYLSRSNTRKGGNAFDIVKAYEKYSSSTKGEFARWLDRQVAGVLRSGIKDKAGNPPEDVDAFTDSVVYGDTANRDIENVLLLFNLPIAPSDWPSTEGQPRSEDRRYRYPFDLHIQENWSVEHIHAQSPKKPEKDDEVMDYLTGIERMLSEQSETDSVFRGDRESLRKATNALLTKRRNKVGIEKLQRQIDEIHKRIEEAMSDRKDLLDNLALLSGRLNTSIGNGFFFEKRRKIKEEDKAGRFIPRETRNAFLKYYSDKLSGALWDTEDRELYMKEIRTKLTPWFEVAEES